MTVSRNPNTQISKTTKKKTKKINVNKKKKNTQISLKYKGIERRLTVKKREKKFMKKSVSKLKNKILKN